MDPNWQIPPVRSDETGLLRDRRLDVTSGHMKESTKLSRGERFQRVGELLSKGITLLLIDRVEEQNSQPSSPRSTRANPQPTTETEQPRPNDCIDTTQSAILSYLDRVGSASPRNIQTGLDLPKTTVYRYLTRLLKEGMVTRFGKTTSVQYRASQSSVHRGSGGIQRLKRESNQTPKSEEDRVIAPAQKWMA